jgi:hypothetical protein
VDGLEPQFMPKSVDQGRRWPKTIPMASDIRTDSKDGTSISLE